MMTADQPLGDTRSTSESTASSVDLADFVSSECFPATRDGLLALLVRRRAPASLLWQVGRLSQHRCYARLDDIRVALSVEKPPLPLEPM